MECFVSVGIVVRNDHELLSERLPAVEQELRRRFSDFEILVVDRHSTDGTGTHVRGLLRRLRAVRYLYLSAPVSRQVALAAALENAIGDFIVFFDLRSDPVEAVGGIVAQALGGTDITVGVAETEQTLPYRFVRGLMARIVKRIGYVVPSGATGLLCVSRAAANALMASGRFHQQFVVRLIRTGFALGRFEYTLWDAGPLRRTLRAGVRSFMNLMVYNSTLPLRWMGGLGFAGSALAFLIALYSFVTRLVMENVAPGWASQVMFQSAMFMILFAIQAIFGEYLARLLNEHADFRDYHIVSEESSSVMIDEDRTNVLADSMGENRVDQS
jgi:glycosyltransferase involved in cell wall biosynthesis